VEKFSCITNFPPFSFKGANLAKFVIEKDRSFFQADSSTVSKINNFVAGEGDEKGVSINHDEIRFARLMELSCLLFRTN
jgi:hypothetical protein